MITYIKFSNEPVFETLEVYRNVVNIDLDVCGGVRGVEILGGYIVKSEDSNSPGIDIDYSDDLQGENFD